MGKSVRTASKSERLAVLVRPSARPDRRANVLEGQLTIAQRFIAGRRRQAAIEVPVGTIESLRDG